MTEPSRETAKPIADKGAPMSEQEIDYAAVDSFAAAMKEKLDKKRAEGRGGWHDPAQTEVSFLEELLEGHMLKGDMVDVGNFAMMIWNRTRPIPSRETDQTSKAESGKRQRSCSQR